LRRHKAAKPVSATTENRLHVTNAGRQERHDAYKSFDPSAQPGFLSVYDGQTCIGHLLPRNKLGTEAYDQTDRSIGIYPSQRLAADALTRAARGHL
jgi:hypothetical protein